LLDRHLVPTDSLASAVQEQNERDRLIPRVAIGHEQLVLEFLTVLVLVNALDEAVLLSRSGAERDHGQPAQSGHADEHEPEDHHGIFPLGECSGYSAGKRRVEVHHITAWLSLPQGTGKFGASSTSGGVYPRRAHGGDKPRRSSTQDRSS